MTLTVAFIRNLPDRENREELVFASDSRLSNGQRLDHSTKIFELPRSDALLAFAGDTSYAYPLAHQMISAIRVYPRNIQRRFPLQRARGHMLRVFDQVYRSIHGLPVGHDLPIEDQPSVQFLFGGYAWQDKAFKIWSIELHRQSRKFRFKPVSRFCFIGDKDAVIEARSRLMQLLRKRNRDANTIDMEPFEVLRDIIRENKHSGIGGAPQMAKIYQHMNSQFFATMWPHEEWIKPHIFGRPIQPIESCSWAFFDPDSLRFRTGAPPESPTYDQDPMRAVSEITWGGA